MTVLSYCTGDIKTPQTYIAKCSSPASHTHFVPIFITGVMTKGVISRSAKFCATLSIIVFVTDHPDPVANGSCRAIVCMSLPGLVRKNCTTLSQSVNQFTVAYQTQHRKFFKRIKLVTKQTTFINFLATTFSKRGLSYILPQLMKDILYFQFSVNHIHTNFAVEICCLVWMLIEIKNRQRGLKVWLYHPFLPIQMK